ncbi:MAG: glycosyltransferase family 1 protein [Lachnospiraceae bacterium]|jgi:glycosyltransferase involved in cell wall biosynthesis|nr:glycosyltransferase family 1 protein [Lachnospiraceae bacterium]MCH4064574.1 glycosyltransferase family 1 protein [Lachnospiraceae bacterium]MCH4104805.1 glycosyltransferase family 1 protein [Lachnospiraceae bacterium]MCI1308552.1 glycosyltransferase family 1 protein [Lachnospiraceae bacterium]MCI1357501.1 glycosyltransferase family 1 protein [Lachnospiraceae bacterium]
MIRVLQVVTYMGRGGLESMLMNYYRHIDRQRVQFDFLVHRQERAAYDDEIEALGGKIYRLPRLVPWSRSYLSSLNHFFDTHPEYKIVHVHQDCLSSVILKAAAQHQVPIRIAHSHSANQDKNLKYLIKLWYRRSIPRYATQLFACGKAAGDWMFCGAPYQIVRNAIDISQYVYNPEKQVEMRKKLALPDGLIVGHVGRFNPPKNHAFLVDIFAALLKKEPSATLLLVGDGDGLPQIKSKVKSLGISDHVRFLGLRSDVADLMQAMNVFVFPSLYEGLPLTMIEAQASGLPCIISDKVSEECIVTDRLVSTESLSASPSQWADRILSIRPTSRGNHRDEIAANGFDISNEAIKLQEYYIHANEQCH